MHPKFNKYKIGELFEVQLGKMLDERAKKGEQVDYLANFNVRWGAFDFSKLNQMNFSEKEKEKFSLICGDLLMCEGGEIGRCAVWKDERANIYYQKALHRIRAKSNKCTTDYLSLYFQYLAQTGQLTKFVGESSIAHLTRETLIGLHIFCPTLIQQKTIADLLATWDEAIEKTERLIQAKEQQQTGVIQELINSCCSSWPHTKPSKMFDLISEKNSPSEELLSVTQDRGVIPRSMLEGRVMSPEGTTESYKLIQSGDFVISLRSFQGGIEYSNYRGLISPAYTVLRPKIDLDRDFYRLFFKTTIFIEKYLNLAVIGIRDGKQISIPDFMTIPLPFPEMSDQKKIAGTMLIKQREIDLLKQLAEKYKSQKRGLMQKLLTGQWRIKPEVINKYGEQ